MTAPGHIRTQGEKALGLEIRFSLFVVMVVTIMAAIAALASWIVDNEAARSHDRQAGLATAYTIKANAQQALAFGDAAAQQAAIVSIAKDPRISRAELYDPSGALRLAESEAGAALPAAADVAQVLRTGDESVRITETSVLVTLPIVDSNRTIGALRLMVNRAALPDHGGAWIVVLLIGYIAALIIGLPLAVMMARKITRPLQQLTEFSRGLSAQHRDERLDLQTGDEFETLASAFNAMVARFENSMQQIERLAYRDPATDLPNQAGVQKLIHEAVLAAASQRDSGVVYVLRIERLDAMIEMIGADRGQELIGAIGSRLRHRLSVIDQTVRIQRAKDAPSRLARLSSGDFCIITPSFSTGAEAARFAQLLAGILGQPVEWRDQSFSFGSKVGASVFPRDGMEPDTLISQALLAVGVATADGGRVRFFAREMEKVAARRLVAEREIRAAIEQRAFIAHFQPKVDLKTRRIVGSEALARWRQIDGSIVGPARFINAAEEFGLIGPISDLIMLDSCWKAAHWAREGHPTQVSVNVSPLQLVDDRFTDKILRILQETDLPPALLELEITESVALTNPENAARLLRPLKDLGVSLALDDFGCGHSGLSSLTKLPFDVVKIDQSFVRGMHADPSARAIVETILTLADRLGCKVVAEGVETEQQAAWLHGLGCGYGQGFLFGPALSPHEFRRLRDDFENAAARVA